jgi:hypothetical protein
MVVRGISLLILKKPLPNIGRGDLEAHTLCLERIHTARIFAASLRPTGKTFHSGRLFATPCREELIHHKLRRR